MTTTAPVTNDAGFVRFSHRTSSWKGDRYTWARYNAETRELTVYLANSGRISPEYRAEFEAFCRDYGIDFDAMRCGDKVTVFVPAEEPAVIEAA